MLDDGPAPRVRVALTVTNTGERAGHEVVQVYVTDPESTVFRPVQELGGFGVVELAAGASERVEVELDARAFQFWHPEVSRWVAEPGRFGIRVGASSREVRLETEVELTGEVVVPELTIDSTVEAWLAHPVAGPALRAQLEAEPRAAAMFFAPGVGEMMRAIPLRRIARFPGFPVPEAELEAAAAQADAAYRAGAR
ncbi:hypothetical protein GCM10025864_25400 [Luteimicrobium album]|uniref:Fibronectin type III-like domain-containing protein n=1 Tax=Luteimicrobium album TaxID=1054550 RepID=A0ABQ6I3D0_9MICO|nr:hypothetical protein GCM10025864_25400 [Luteimicrobium album]